MASSPRLKGAVLTAALLVALEAAALGQPPECSEPLKEVFRSESGAHSFDSVAVISPDDVWFTGEAVGLKDAYFLHWDGHGWAEETPEFTHPSGNIRALSAAFPDEVWAVGSTGCCPARHVVLHRDGANWSVVETPEAGRTSTLSDVVALEDGTVVAVGGYRPRHAKGMRPLVLRFDGTSWVRDNAGVRGARTVFTDVDGSSLDALWAVPLEGPSVFARGPDGWSRIEMARPNDSLEDVATTPEGSAWFVGEAGGRRRLPVVTSYGAEGWDRFQVPDRRYAEYLYSVAALSDEEVTVAGLRIYGDHAYPYAARMTETGFSYVPADDPGWMAFWDIELDENGRLWAGGEGPDMAIIQRAC